MAPSTRQKEVSTIRSSRNSENATERSSTRNKRKQGIDDNATDPSKHPKMDVGSSPGTTSRSRIRSSVLRKTKSRAAADAQPPKDEVGTSERSAVVASTSRPSTSPATSLHVAPAVSNKAAGFFKNAQNTVISNSSMVDIGTQIVYSNDRSNEVLKWLEGHIMLGAEFDSSARDPPPRCHPGTRTTIIQRAQDWFNDSEREKKLLWLHGPAGVGKSAIVQTLAESESESKRLGASLFFSRPNGRNNPVQVFPTIAYQLAVQDPSYKAYLGELMANPRSLDKSISEQFKKLIAEPFTRRKIRSDSETWLITIDGLDECGEDQEKTRQTRPERHSDHYQCEIVQLITSFVKQHPAAPLIWVIASRPEPHLKAAFSHDNVKDSFWEEDIPVDSDEACQDVEKYLLSQFDETRQQYPDHISAPTWPANDLFLKVAKAASGLFAFASVIILFISDPYIGNPVDQLDCVLSVIDKLAASHRQENPLASLDAVYTEILRRIPSNAQWEVAKRLIAASIQLETAPSTLQYMCNVLGITQSAAVTALRHLHSVLHIPRNNKVGHSRLRFYHASFRDYLQDPSRSHEYYIEEAFMKKLVDDWERGVFSIFQKVLVASEESGVELESPAIIDNLSLSWAPQGSKVQLRKQLAQDAGKFLWQDLIQRNPATLTFPIYLKSDTEISVSRLVLILKNTNFSRLVGSYVAFSDRDALIHMLGQLAELFPEELEQARVLSRVMLSSIHNRPTATVTHWRFGNIYFATYNSGQIPRSLRQSGISQSEFDERVQDLARLEPSTDVMIWGCGHMERLAVFTTRTPTEVFIFPYH